MTNPSPALAARRHKAPDRDGSDDALLPQASPWLLAWFRWYTNGYLAKHFHAVRLSRSDRPAIPGDQPLIVYMNHPAWWDPLMGLVVAERLFSNRTHYAPVEARSLARYALLGRLGFFGIDPRTRRGAASFLRTATAILSRRATALWLTPEGHFTDPRRRAEFQPGLAHLARRLPRGVLLPLAVEYPFWQERTPEALARFGAAIRVEDHQQSRVDQWNEVLQSRLHAAQDALAEQSIAREPGGFETLIDGAAGIGGMYDRWRRFQALLTGRRFQRQHEEAA